MASPGDHPELSLRMDGPPGLARIDGRCLLQTRDERCVVTVSGVILAYQAEGELTRLVGKHYHRAEDEGRTLVQSALASAADLIVTETELRVVSTPMSSPHRTKAIAALCEELNAAAAVFPGSALRLRCVGAAQRRVRSGGVRRAGR